MKIIENLLMLLQRVDLKGSEVPAFNECVDFLNNLHKEETEKITKKDTNNTL